MIDSIRIKRAYLGWIGKILTALIKEWAKWPLERGHSVFCSKMLIAVLHAYGNSEKFKAV